MIMPVAQMHEQFLHWFDKQANFASPEVTPEEIDIYLNNAYYQFLKVLAEQGLEKSQEWLDYTKDLVRSYSTTSFTTGTKPNGKLVPLPDFLNTFSLPTPYEYRLALLEEADITFTNCGQQVSRRIPVIPITRDEYNKLISNPFKKPWKEEIVRLVSDYTGNPNTSSTSGTHYFEIIGFTGATITRYYLDCIKEPQKIQYASQYSVKSFIINGVSAASGLVTYTTAAAHNLYPGGMVSVTGVNGGTPAGGYNTASSMVINTTSNSFTLANPTTGAATLSTPLVTMLNQNCELEAKAATKIVEMAVELAMKTLGDPRLQLEQLDKLVKQI
jgi:hypothetical protein